MLLLLLTVGGVAIVMGAMALGVLLSGRRLKGSCGGEGSASCPCEATGVPVEQRACEQLSTLRTRR